MVAGILAEIESNDVDDYPAYPSYPLSVQFERITIDPEVMAGQPCIRGLRFPVVSVLRMVAGGMSVEEILGEHPDLEADDIPAALNYAAEALAEHYYPLRSSA